jgi:hypothetical protein
MAIKHWLIVAALGAMSTTLLAQERPGPGGGPPPEMRARFDAVNKSCAEDLKKSCGGQAGREGMMCLRQNQDKVSAPCREALSQLPARREGGPPRN